MIGMQHSTKHKSKLLNTSSFTSKRSHLFTVTCLNYTMPFCSKVLLGFSIPLFSSYYLVIISWRSECRLSWGNSIVTSLCILLLWYSTSSSNLQTKIKSDKSVLFNFRNLRSVPISLSGMPLFSKLSLVEQQPCSCLSPLL